MRFYKKEYLNICSGCGEKYMREIDRDRCESSHLTVVKKKYTRKVLDVDSEEYLKRKEYFENYYRNNEEKIRKYNAEYFKKNKLEQKNKKDENNF